MKDKFEPRSLMTDVYFLGHPKCATNWMRLVFKRIAQEKHWNYEVHQGINDFLKFDNSERTIKMFVNAVHENFKIPKHEKAVHLLRDPRDAMISCYWSWKNNHKNNNAQILAVREVLNGCSLTEGLEVMINQVMILRQIPNYVPGKFKNILDIRYEELIDNSFSVFDKMFKFLDLGLTDEKVQFLTDEYSFKRLTGRFPGNEDRDSHFRKGVAGDWRNYFNPEIKNRFKAKHGEALVLLGYEKDMEW